jgi:hypothetical protein
MVPATLQPQSDSESLQADVMRFMAIIAFCLIAILALVRHAEPPQPTATPAPQPQTAAQTNPTQLPHPAWEEPIERPAEVARPEPSPKPAREQRRLDVDALRPRATVAATSTVPPSPAPAKKAAPAPPAPPAAAPAAPAQTPSESEGLSLRFASDGDFLRLIARGDITVYAFNGKSVLSLTNAYDFLTAHSPGQLYEILPQTIPGLIIDALVRARQPEGDSSAFSWGVTLPERIRKQIAGHLDAGSSGELVIDRYGEVHHVAAD